MNYFPPIMDQLLFKGDEAFKKGNLRKALKDYTYALQKDSNNVPLLVRICACESSLEKYEDLLTTSEQILKKDKKCIEGYYFKAISLLQTKKLKESKNTLLVGLAIDEKSEKLKELLKQVDIELSLDPKKSLELKELGNDFFNKGKYPEAIEQYELAMKQNPKDFNLYHNKGFCLQKLGQLDLAIQFFSIAIELNPKLLKSFYKLGQCYYEKKELVNSIEILKRGLDIELNTEIKLFYEKVVSEIEIRAKELIEQGTEEMKSDKLIESFNFYQKAYDIYKVTKNQKGERNVLSQLGVIYTQNQEYEKALYHFNLCLNLDKELDDKEGESMTHVNIGSIYLLMKNLESSLKHYNSAFKIQTKIQKLDPTLLKNLSFLHQQKIEFDKSIYYLDLLAKQDEKDYQTLIQIAAIYEKINNLIKAKEYYDKSLKIKELGKVYLNYGAILENENEYQKSIECFFKSLELFQKESDENGICLSYLNLGILYLKLKDKESSIKYFKKSLEFTKDEKMKFGILENLKKSESL